MGCLEAWERAFYRMPRQSHPIPLRLGPNNRLWSPPRRIIVMNRRPRRSLKSQGPLVGESPPSTITELGTSSKSAPVASDRVELAAPTNVSAVSHTQHEFAVDEPLSSAAVAQPAHADVSAYSQESTTPDPSHPVTSLEDRQPNQAEGSAVPAPETNPQVELDDHAAASREESICRATSSARLHAPLRLPRSERLRMRMLRIPNKAR